MDTILYPWQVKALEDQRTRMVLTVPPRMGKSLYAIKWLEQIQARRIVISAPLGILPQWRAFLETHFKALGAFRIVAAYKMTPKTLSAALDDVRAQGIDFIVLTSHDRIKGLKAGKPIGVLKQLIDLKPDAFIVDESHYVKSPSSDRGKHVRYLARHVPYIRLLTGTVAPNGVEDLWGQFNCIDEKLWATSYTGFKRRHLIVNEYDYGRVVGIQDPKRLESMIQACSLSFNREQEFGKDNWITTVRELEFEPKQREMYRAIVKQWVLEQEIHGLDLEVPHALSRMLRLRQLTSGFLPDGEDKLHIHSLKIDAVMEDLNDIHLAGEKVVIFHRFRWEGQRILYALNRPADRKHAQPSSVFSISGDTPPERRAAQISEFAKLEGAGTFVCQTAAGGIGISFASAIHCLFISQSYSYSEELQARDRIYSPGTTRCVTYYHVKNTIDEYIFNVLQTKKNFNEAIRSSTINDIAYGEKLRFEGNIK